MKTKTKQFIQNLSHDIEDEEKAESYLDESLPLVGLAVMYFNSLKSRLTHSSAKSSLIAQTRLASSSFKS